MAGVSGGAPGAVDEFVAKWLAHEPEMAMAEVFVPATIRPLHRAWGALLHELRQALFELGEPTVREAKLAWWSEELAQLAEGRARHPLTAQLSAPAPWSGLATGLLGADLAARRPADSAQALGDLLPLAGAVIAVESALFESSGGEPEARALAVHWLIERLNGGLGAEDGARVPLNLLARHAVTAAELVEQPAHPVLREWGGALASALPEALGTGVLLRQQRFVLDRARLRRLSRGGGWPRPLGVINLVRAWAASRRGLRATTQR